MRIAPGSEQTVGRRGETSGARDGLTLRPKVLETRGVLALARVQDVEPNQMGLEQMEAEELPETRSRERKFGPDWIFLILLVVCTAYTLMQFR